MIIEHIDNIEDYLHQHEHKDMLRFITCGSVDDGKSTLIGRLLHDSKMIFEDQLAAITRDSAKHGTTGEVVDLALLVDGLQSEREQGITIDVAYRFFATDTRKYIIADTPGHEQYTRNMATGASTADVAILLIDARYGVQVQTRRHSFICSLLGIKHFVVAINKMDLVDYSQARFDEIKADFEAFVAPLNVPDVQYVPMSALLGENVVNAGTTMPWYSGPTMLALLDALPIQRDEALAAMRLPVQYVNRPNLNFRGFCGTLAAGRVTPGMAIKALPSGKTSTVKSIVVWEGELAEAHAGQAITLTLTDEIDISRGDMIVAADDTLSMAHGFDAHLVWMHEAPLQVGKTYDFKIGTTFTSGRITEIVHQIDVNTLATSAAEQLPLNGIALCRVQLTRAVAFDAYKQCHATGSLIIIDRLNNITVGAGMIHARHEGISHSDAPVSASDREQRLGQAAVRIVLEASGAQALAEQVESALFAAGALPAIASDSAVVAALQAAGLMVIVPEEVVGERSVRIRDAAEAIAPQQLASGNAAAAAEVVALLRAQGLLH
ncbi:bifunctional enzyme CysN/CysC [Paraperlucidibaca baekdonensis]|uniref:Sulfate adenylyltransferase subunit 1 n=1 Tax=Paraperlucidibaca baekdonensis TaxID=748120 RepID=A0A3E0H419_9GAMM|nr:sulfate adenylyltransferase subunit CysN [Paraperlucidibaca baekdonensis]REH37881.1 bifunctional enzyme CysN/CysC [Paraperlucidibaca baekdonensis]